MRNSCTDKGIKSSTSFQNNKTLDILTVNCINRQVIYEAVNSTTTAGF